MFEKAARLKLRFDTPKGPLSVEELWDLPLTVRNGGASLDNVARAASKQIKETETESFVVKNPTVSPLLQLRLDVVKHIIAVRIAEAETAATAADKAAKKQTLLALVAEKKNEQLKSSSIDELMAQINAL